MNTEGILILIFGIIVVLLILVCLFFLFKLYKEKKVDQKDYSAEINAAINSSIMGLSSTLKLSFETLSASQKNSINDLKERVNKSIGDMKDQISQTNKMTETQLDNMRKAINTQINNLSSENAKKLDQMRNVVDEKLQKTLNDRITASFKEVSDGLSKVIGVVDKMQDVSNKVGSLNNVLNNVKTKGIFGEAQLGNILSDILTEEQYETNVITKKGSRDPVEFAVILPGNKEGKVLLPIDSKFPLNKYEDLQHAYDLGDADEVRRARQVLKNELKKEAKDISTKYIDTPNTTDFAILFLPFESLYSEVMNLDVVREIQNTYHVVVSGPSTMSALLNSLSMGFKTLALQKNSAAIYDVLRDVQKEFGTFEEALTKAQDNITKAGKSMETLVGVRTRAMNRKLKKIEEIKIPIEEQQHD
ncbi:MAG: DNA recombination protein RmuC [Bacilli bacterium]|nr:DNA recombination protein RmuC [Bacilli bacterium]